MCPAPGVRAGLAMLTILPGPTVSLQDRVVDHVFRFVIMPPIPSDVAPHGTLEYVEPKGGFLHPGVACQFRIPGDHLLDEVLFFDKPGEAPYGRFGVEISSHPVNILDVLHNPRSLTPFHVIHYVVATEINVPCGKPGRYPKYDHDLRSLHFAHRNNSPGPTVDGPGFSLRHEMLWDIIHLSLPPVLGFSFRPLRVAALWGLYFGAHPNLGNSGAWSMSKLLMGCFLVSPGGAYPG